MPVAGKKQAPAPRQNIPSSNERSRRTEGHGNTCFINAIEQCFRSVEYYDGRRWPIPFATEEYPDLDQQDVHEYHMFVLMHLEETVPDFKAVFQGMFETRVSFPAATPTCTRAPSANSPFPFSRRLRTCWSRSSLPTKLLHPATPAATRAPRRRRPSWTDSPLHRLPRQALRLRLQQARRPDQRSDAVGVCPERGRLPAPGLRRAPRQGPERWPLRGVRAPRSHVVPVQRRPRCGRRRTSRRRRFRTPTCCSTGSRASMLPCKFSLAQCGGDDSDRRRNAASLGAAPVEH